jgi:O-antigen/teichoic acid export membrane protein
VRDANDSRRTTELHVDGVSRKLMKGAGWLTLTRLLMNSLGLISVFVLARLLSPSDFGIVAIATAVLAITSTITDLSLSAALVQRQDLVDDHFHSVWTIGLMQSLAIFACIGLAAYPLAQLYGDPRLTAVLIATGFIGALGGLVSPKLVMLTRDLVFWQEFAMQGTHKVLVFLGSVICAIVFQNYWALIAGNLIGGLCSLAISYIIAPYLPRVSFAKFRELFSYSFWLSLASTVNTLNLKFDQLVLGYFVGKTSLGLYTVADNLSALPVRESTTPLAKTLFPAFSRMAADPPRLRQAYTRAQTLVCAIGLPAGFGFALVADPVVRGFLGPKWIDAIPIIQILSGTFAFQTLSSSLPPLAMALGATKVLFGRDMRTLLIRVPFIVVGFLAGGLLGVVIGRSVSSFIGTIWNMALVRDLSGIPIVRQFADNARALASTALMVAVTGAGQMLFDHLKLRVPALLEVAGLIALGALTYVIATVALWRLAGRPRGPESEVLDLAAKVFPALQALVRPAKLSDS